MELFESKVLKDIGAALLKNKETIAVAESVTTGLLQFALGSIADASNFFQGGITAYNIAQKYRYLGIEPISALDCNCVSAEVARQMATGVCRLLHSHWGIGITGYASPVPESDNKVFAYYAIAYGPDIMFEDLLKKPVEEPLHLQLYYINRVLSALQKQLHSSVE